MRPPSPPSKHTYSKHTNFLSLSLSSYNRNNTARLNPLQMNPNHYTLMDDLRFCHSNIMSVKSGRREGNNVNLCSMEPRLLLKILPTLAGIEPRSARSAGRRLSL